MAATPDGSTKHRIPHSFAPETDIVGKLEHRAPPSPSSAAAAGSSRKEVALILHGVKGHKDYLHQKLLARSLPVDSFRFDHRGNFETEGEWSLAAFERDVEDLQVVARYLREEMGYRISMVIGHSRGAIVGAWWLSHCAEELRLKEVGKFVHLCGRYRMERIWDREAEYSQSWPKPHPWTSRVAGQMVTHYITREQVAEFAAWSNDYPTPSHIAVLNVGAGMDSVVPPEDVHLWQAQWERRPDSRTTLYVVEEADHNLIGFFPEVVQTICDWSELVDARGDVPRVWEDRSREPLSPSRL